MKHLLQKILILVALGVCATAHAQWVGYQFISRSTDGTQVGAGDHAQVTPNGRYVVYVSTATGLVSPPTAGWQIFLFDRWRGVTELISQNASGQYGNGSSNLPSISDDGCRVVFESRATNLVVDAGSANDIFVRERCTVPAQTRVASSTAAGVAGKNTSGLSAESSSPRISGSGRYVTFHTYAANLVGGNCGVCSRIVRKDLDTGAVVVASLKPDSSLGEGRHPDISFDGSRIVFYGSESGLGIGTKTVWDHFLWDAAAPNTLTIVTTGSSGERQIYDSAAAIYYNGQVHQPAISADGRYVAFATTSATLTPLGGNGKWQVYVKDTLTGTLTLASVAPDGALGDGDSNMLQRAQMSRNGRQVAFFSYSSNLITATAQVKPLIRDLATGTTTLIADQTVSATSAIGFSPDTKGRYAVNYFGQTSLDSNFPNHLGLYLADFYPLQPAVNDITPILSIILD